PPGTAVRRASGDRALLRADHLPHLRAGWPRQHGGRLHRRVHLCAVHRRRRFLFRGGMGLRHRLRLLHRRHVLAPARHLEQMIGNYPVHLAILVLLWGYIYTSWSVMGRLGLVSFGHGAFMGIGAYTALNEGTTVALGALQFSPKWIWLAIVGAVWLGGLVIWRMVDRSMGRLALQAIAEEEEAAASIGIHVTRAKLRITIISALMTCV